MSSDPNKPTGSGLKIALQKIDLQINKINKDISENALTILNLKNQTTKLQNTFQNKYSQLQRNIQIDLQKFQDEILRNTQNQINSKKMLQKKIKEIQISQLQLAQNLFNAQIKVKNLEESLG